MRIMAPLMRRYSQEIKTGAFTITTARTKEKKQVGAQREAARRRVLVEKTDKGGRDLTAGPGPQLPAVQECKKLM